jgi:hypothetical protein
MAKKTAAATVAPQRLKMWVGGVTVVATGAASVYGLFANGRVATFAFIGMVAAIILLLVVQRAIKLSESNKEKDSEWWDLIAKLLVGFVLLYLAVLLVFLFPVVYRMMAASGEDTPHSGANQKPPNTFAHLLENIPAEHVKPLKDWIRADLWDTRYTESNSLPSEADWSAVKIESVSTLYRLSLWRAFAKDSAMRSSPVLVERSITAVKLKDAHWLRMIVATEGLGVVAVCTSGQSFLVETGAASGVSETKHFSREAHVLVDIDNYKIGERFTLTVRGVQWNGLQREDPWLCLVSYGRGIGKLTIEAPASEQFLHVKWLKYPPGESDGIDAKGEGVQVMSPAKNSLIWDRIDLAPKHVYEIAWSFDPK